jgi:hypothetical protein
LWILAGEQAGCSTISTRRKPGKRFVRPQPSFLHIRYFLLTIQNAAAGISDYVTADIRSCKLENEKSGIKPGRDSWTTQDRLPGAPKR